MAEEMEVRGERVSSCSYSCSSKVAPIMQHEIPTMVDTSSNSQDDDVYLRVIGEDVVVVVTESIIQEDHHHDEANNNINNKTMNMEAWLPITESRKGSWWTAAFHLVCSGIGIQSLVLPLAFVSLGWVLGIVCLAVMYVWQLYTIWILVQLHESSSGSRYSRYLHLSIVAFGEKLGKLISIFPVMYLSGGGCVMFIINGARTMKLFHQAMSGDGPKDKVLSGAEWYLVFICVAIALALFFPNLNSLARVSLVGSVAAFASCTLIWILSISKQRPQGVSHHRYPPGAPKFHDIMNALGIIALAFRGHNLVLEIQGTMPTNPTYPSRKHMWKGVMISYALIAMCLFPLAIGGYWAYGNMMPENGGLLSALSKLQREQKISKFVMGTVYMTVVMHYLSAFQIYGMPVLDNWERIYSSKKKKPCPRWLRSAIKILFGGLTYLVAVAFPFIGSLGALIGAIALPLTLAFPCFMWICIKKPRPMSIMWCVNMLLGSSGLIMSVLLGIAALWNLVADGLDANFFNPR